MTYQSTGVGLGIVQNIVQAITDFAGGVGKTIVDVFNSIALETSAEGVTTLTAFAQWSLAFLGISLTIGVITAILRKVG